MTDPEKSPVKALEDAFYVEDRSLLAPSLKWLITRHVFKVLPASYSANQLTLSGGACALMVVAAMWFASFQMRANTLVGDLLLILSAVLLITYTVFDQLDGMQARRLGTSSSFGDFIDHWVDTAIANLVPVPIMLMLGIDEVWIFWMALFVALAFWAANWEVRSENRRILPWIGGLESVVIGAAILLITAAYGVATWTVEVLGLPVYLYVYFLCIPWLLVVIIGVTRRALPRRVGFPFDITACLMTLAPILAWNLILAPTYNEGYLAFNLGFLIQGLIATLMTGALIRQHWLGVPYRPVGWVYLVLGSIPLIAGVAGASDDVLEIVLGVTALALIGALIHQGLDTYRAHLAVRQQQ